MSSCRASGLICVHWPLILMSLSTCKCFLRLRVYVCCLNVLDQLEPPDEEMFNAWEKFCTDQVTNSPFLFWMDLLLETLSESRKNSRILDVKMAQTSKGRPGTCSKIVYVRRWFRLWFLRLILNIFRVVFVFSRRELLVIRGDIIRSQRYEADHLKLPPLTDGAIRTLPKRQTAYPTVSHSMIGVLCFCCSHEDYAGPHGWINANLSTKAIILFNTQICGCYKVQGHLVGTL